MTTNQADPCPLGLPKETWCAMCCYEKNGLCDHPNDKTLRVSLTVEVNPKAIVDEILYRSYRYNRQRAPEIRPEDWARIYANVPAMEQRYQEEIKENANGR